MNPTLTLSNGQKYLLCELLRIISGAKNIQISNFQIKILKHETQNTKHEMTTQTLRQTVLFSF